MRRTPALLATLIAFAGPAAVIPLARSAEPTEANPAALDWVELPGFAIARTETTIGQFRLFAQATGLVTAAERAGGGSVFESGWSPKPGWTWRAPYGPGHAARDDEPAAHVTWREAQAFCRWAGGALPTDAQWVSAAYTEQRADPPAPFVRGRTYPWPTGDRPDGAQCLGDCGAESTGRSVRHGAALTRGTGHARAGASPAGVNGLHDMGGNLWEWVDHPPGAAEADAHRMRGGSWWYGAAQMRADWHQAKPGDTAVVYIGFRCARAGRPRGPTDGHG